MNEAETVKKMVADTRTEIIVALASLMGNLPHGYIVTGCGVDIGRVDMTGGGSAVYVNDVWITVEVSTPPPSTTAPSTPAP